MTETASAPGAWVGLDLADPRCAYLLAMADDELVLGHRHLHWTGVAPSLEEDLAFSTLGQDEINHADVWYQVLVGGDRDAVDAAGLGRSPDQYRHAVLCERLPGDFALTLARQFLYDHFDRVRLEALRDSAEGDLAAVATRLAHEERYHLAHAEEWLERIARGGHEPAGRLRRALEAAWADALWLFEPTPGEHLLVQQGVVPLPSRDLVGRWVESMTPALERAGYIEVVAGLVGSGAEARLPEGFFASAGGRQGVHTLDWTDDAWVEMTALYRSDPDARW